MDDNVELKESHHTSGVYFLLSCINLEEDDIYEDIEYASEDVCLSMSLSKEDVIIDTPP